MTQKVDLVLHNIQIALTVNQKSEVLKNISILIQDKKIINIVPSDEGNSIESDRNSTNSNQQFL